MHYERFTILNQLGKGSSATVYYAKDHWADGDVILKVPNDTSLLWRSFKIENDIGNYRILQPVEYARDWATYEPFLAKTLSSLSKSISDIPLSHRLEIFYKILSSIREIHYKGWVHGDISPSNILIKDKEVKITDFGLAVKDGEKAKGLGHIIYASSEAIKGEKITRKADIYSLGVILHFLLTNTLPFDTSNLLDIMKSKKEAKISPAVPRKYKPLLKSLISYSPEHRISDVEDIISYFERETELKEFYGRYKEIQEFNHLLKKHFKGIIYIEGEAGIGKTTFLKHICNEARKHGWISIYGRNLKEIRDGIQERIKIWGFGKANEDIDGIKKILDISPLFIGIDDLHTQTEEKLEYIKRVFPLVLNSPVMIAVTLRPKQASKSIPGKTIFLKGLEEEAFSSLLYNISSDISQKKIKEIYHQAKGNPLWAKEIVMQGGKIKNYEEYFREKYSVLTPEEKKAINFIAFTQPFPARKFPFKQIFPILRKKGLIESTPKNISLYHPLFADTVKKNISQKDAHSLVNIIKGLSGCEEIAGDLYLRIGKRHKALDFYLKSFNDKRERWEDTLRLGDKILPLLNKGEKKFIDMFEDVFKALRIIGKIEQSKEYIDKYAPYLPSEMASYYYGYYYFEKGEFHKAIQIFEENIPEKEGLLKNSYLAMMGGGYSILGNLEKAEQILKEAYKNTPRGTRLYPEICVNLGTTHWSKGDNKKSIQWTKKAMNKKYSNTYAVAAGNLGVSYAGKGDWEKALKYFIIEREEALRQGLWDALYYSTTHIASAYNALKKIREAEKYFDEVSSYIPHISPSRDRAYIMSRYAKFLKDTGRIKEAYKIDKEILKIKDVPATSVILLYHGIGIVSYLLGKYKEALKWFNKEEEKSKIVGNSVRLIFSRIGKAKILWTMGEEKEAIKIIKESAEMAKHKERYFIYYKIIASLHRISIYNGKVLELPEIPEDIRKNLKEEITLNYAISNIQKGKWDEAYTEIHKLLSFLLYHHIYINIPEIGTFFLLLLKRRQETREFNKWFNILLNIAKSQPLYLWKYYEIKGDTKKAEEILKKLSRDTDCPEKFIKIQKERWNIEKNLG